VLLSLLLPGCSFVAERAGAPRDPADSTELVVEVPAGATARSMAPILEEAGVIDDAGDFVLWVRLTKEGGCIKAGRHKVRPDMDAAAIVASLCAAPLASDVPFTVVEGWRIREIDAALAQAGLAEAGAYSLAVSTPSAYTASFPLPTDTLEGYLFPETYMVDPTRFTVEGFVQRQLDLFGERFASKHSEEELAGRGLHPLVIMASMLEREEPKPEQRPMVAGILWKRLDNNWNLGVDATSRYTLEQWNDRKAFLKLLRDPNDIYNTRLRGGLPPTPIGNPSTSSLEAALAPTDSPYWYYLHDAQQNLHPATDVAGHEANRRKYNVY